MLFLKKISYQRAASKQAMLTCLRANANIQTERRLLVLLTFYGVVITLLHVVNIQTIFLIQPKTMQFIQKNSVYYGSRCYGCDDLIQNGVEKKELDKVELLIAVPSSADHFQQRIWIRETWGQREPSLFGKKAIYFFLGKSSNESVNEAVRNENQKYKDIVQAGFNETYDNLTFKTLSILYWVHHRISHGKFKPRWIFKCDDDNLVDIYSFEKYLKSLESPLDANEIYCYVRDDAVPLRPGQTAVKDWEKWAVSHETWSDPLYPKCCYGPAYILTPQGVMHIVRAYEKTLVQFSKFEDIYITGKWISSNQTRKH